MKRIVAMCVVVTLLMLASVAVADEPMKLNWVGYYADAENHSEIVKILEEKFNVEFDMWSSGGLGIRLAAGEIPDVFSISFSTLPTYARDEVIAEVPWEMIEEYAPDINARYEEELWSPFDKHLSEVDGKNYGLVIVNAETGGYRQLIVYRGDWIENVGAAVPTTLVEFEELMYKFTKEDPDKNGVNDTFGLSDRILGAVYGAFGYNPQTWSVRDGKLQYGAIQPEMKDALALLAKWYADGVLHPEFVTGENNGTSGGQVSTQFVSGQIGVTAQGYLYWKPAFIQGQREGFNIVEMRVTNPDAIDSLVYGQPPIGPGGKSGAPAESPIHPRRIVMGVQLQDEPEKLQKILEILNYSIGTEEGFLLTRFGVEGVHYTLDEEGFPLGKENFGEWAVITSIGGGTVFNQGSWLPSIMNKINSEAAWGATLPGLRENGIYNEMLVTPESSGSFGAELDKIQKEAYMDIITGRQPIEYFDEFVSIWLENGGEIVTEDANALR